MERASVQRGLLFTFRLFSLIRPGLRPVHLPRRGRLPPGGGCIHGARPSSLGVPSTPGPAGPPSPSRRGRGIRRKRGGARSDPVPPHTRRLRAAPSPRRGLRPLIRHALRRATFPVGEGFLPAGAFPAKKFIDKLGFSAYDLEQKKPYI